MYWCLHFCCAVGFLGVAIKLQNSVGPKLLGVGVPFRGFCLHLQDHAHKHNVPMDWTSCDIPLSELALHNHPNDCWIALFGDVYDLTDFLQHYPEQRNAILAWAGRDATPMFDMVPGSFPSKHWMEYYMRPHFKTGTVGPETGPQQLIAINTPFWYQTLDEALDAEDWQ
ncbi:CYTB5-B [Symbiodinium sp. CCMP2456]|nr:CYTB5-B [Symbiodinium sp. CCMP2456]